MLASQPGRSRVPVGPPGWRYNTRRTVPVESQVAAGGTSESSSGGGQSAVGLDAQRAARCGGGDVSALQAGHVAARSSAVALLVVKVAST
jgi:hypothetical protein